MNIDQFYLRYTFDAKHDRLGSGAFGTVYKAYDNVLNLYKAIKIAKVQIINGKEFSLLSEYQNVKNIPVHTNIANYEAVYQFQTKHEVTDFAVMQYYENGTLKDILKSDTLLPKQRLTIINGLLNGVSHLHKAGIIHRDLKAGNILIAKDQKGEYIPKISDFGLSKLLEYGLDESMSNSFQGGSIDYSSPEQLMGLKLMQNTDIWSLGVLLFEIFTGKKPFQGEDVSITPEIKRHTTLVKIFKGQISEHINLCPDPYKDIILLCLRLDPFKRIRNVDQIYKFLEFPELLNNTQDNELWDQDETIIFGFEEQNRSTFPTVFHKFLIDLGIARLENGINPDLNLEENIVSKRKKYVDDKNFEHNELKLDTQNLIVEADNLTLEGYFEKAIIKYQQSIDIYPSNDVLLKINELKINVNKAENLLIQAQGYVEQNDHTLAQKLVLEAIEIYPQFQKAFILNKEIEELLLHRNKKVEFDKLIHKGEFLIKGKRFDDALKSFNDALLIFPSEEYPLAQIQIIQNFINLELSEKQKKAEYDALVEAGDKALKMKDFDKSIELYHKAALLYKTEALTTKIEKALNVKSDLAIQMQDLETQKAIQLKIDNLILQAQKAEKKQKYQVAIDFYSRVLDFSTENKDIKAAIQRLSVQLKADEIQSKYEALVKKAEVSFSNGKFDEAQNYINEVALLLPLTSQHSVLRDKILVAIKEKQIESEISNLIAEGQRLYNTGLKEEALKIFKQALSLSKNKSKTAAQYIGNIQSELNQEKIALEMTSMKADAEKEILRGNYDQAIRIFQGLCKKYPSEKGLKFRLEEILKLNLDRQNKEKEKQDKLAFSTLITETNQCIQEKKYKYALKLVDKALLIYPENKAALDLKAFIEQLLKEEKIRIIPWYVQFSNFASGNQKYLFSGIVLLVFLGTAYHVISKPKSEKASGQLEIFKNEAGLFGCKLNEKEIVLATFDTLYMDTSNGLNGVRNDSVFSITSDGALSLISYTKPEAPAMLTKEWIDSITDIDELYSLINQFPNNPLIPSINKKIKLLEEQKESKSYREILKIQVLETKLAALEAFIKEFPKSKLIKEIKVEMAKTIDLIANNLSEADLFNKAKSQNSFELLKEYIKNYPNGRYANEANSLIEKKQEQDDDIAWSKAEKEATDNNITQPLTDYLSQYSIHAQEAKALIADIERSIVIKREQEEKIRKEHAALWNGIKIKEDLAEVIKFISDHPNSIFIKDALVLKEKLESPEIPDFIRDIESKMADFGGGSFTLGCDKGSNCDDDASPAIRVNIKNVAISKYEVTQAEYKAIMGTNPSYFNDCLSCPVEKVSFDDAMEYIRKLNALPGNPYKFRLPTEAEWEYFALANKNTIYAGSDDIDKVAQYGTKTGGTVKVSSKKPNDFGIYGMTGNVAEWCADYYHKDAYTKYNGKMATDPTANRVVRGGSFKDNARFCKVKSRKSVPSDEKADWLGFRLVREIK
ncbi:MAG: protein kinase [Saprospiraceae bacterium]